MSVLLHRNPKRKRKERASCYTKGAVFLSSTAAEQRLSCTRETGWNALEQRGKRSSLNGEPGASCTLHAHQGVSRSRGEESVALLLPSMRKSWPPCCHRMFQTSMDFMRIKSENTRCQKKIEEFKQNSGKSYFFVIMGRRKHSQGEATGIKPATVHT